MLRPGAPGGPQESPRKPPGAQEAPRKPRAPFGYRVTTPPEGTTMRNKNIPIRVYDAETHDCSYAFWAGVAFIVNNILLQCGDFKNVGLAKGSLQNLMPNHFLDYIPLTQLHQLQRLRLVMSPNMF